MQNAAVDSPEQIGPPHADPLPLPAPSAPQAGPAFTSRGAVHWREGPGKLERRVLAIADAEAAAAEVAASSVRCSSERSSAVLRKSSPGRGVSQGEGEAEDGAGQASPPDPQDPILAVGEVTKLRFGMGGVMDARSAVEALLISPRLTVGEVMMDSSRNVGELKDPGGVCVDGGGGSATASGCSIECMLLTRPEAARCICLRRWRGSESRLLLMVGVRAAASVGGELEAAVAASSALPNDLRLAREAWSEGW